MYLGKISPFRTSLILLRDGAPTKHDGAASLADAFRRPQAQVSEAVVVVLWRYELGSPKDIVFQENALGHPGSQLKAKRGLSRATRPCEDKQRKLNKTMPVSTMRANGKRALWLYQSFVRIDSTTRAYVEHWRILSKVPSCRHHDSTMWARCQTVWGSRLESWKVSSRLTFYGPAVSTEPSRLQLSEPGSHRIRKELKGQSPSNCPHPATAGQR